MILNFLLVLLLAVNFSWAAPRETSTVNNERPDESSFTFRKDYMYATRTETYYKQHTTFKTWFEARAICKLEGAELATPFTKTEADMIQNHLSDRPYYTWIGIHDLFTQGMFISVNGTLAEDIYINWSDDEDRDGNCLAITEGGKVRPFKCDSGNAFICAIHRSKVTPNYDCETSSKGYVLESNAGSCYKVHTTPKTWREAFATCAYEDASLAMVNSQVEADLLVKHLAGYPEEDDDRTDVIFLDFSDIIIRGEFFTSNEMTLEESGYSKWRNGTPEYLGQNEHCGIMHRDGKLDHLRCDENAIFICEKILKQTHDSHFDKITTVEAPHKMPALISSGDSDLRFRKDYKYVKETETYYKQHKYPKTWSEAVKICRLEGAELAAPFTKIELEIIQKKLQISNIWLGMHDLFSQGQFITLNGTWTSNIYTNWAPNEWKNNNENQNCLAMNEMGKYERKYCDKSLKFICTKHRSKITLNSDCETIDKDYFFESETGRCYKIHTTPETWREAYIICNYEEATLAMPNSQAEADLFKKYLDKYPDDIIQGNLFLDFTDLISPEEFLTSDGKTLEEAGYSRWHKGPPEDLITSGNCGSLHRDGRLGNLWCEAKASFICQKTLNNTTQLTGSPLNKGISVKAPQDASSFTKEKNNELSNDSVLSYRKDYSYQPETETYYKLHTTPKTWSEAVAMCRLEGANLATDLSNTLQGFLKGRHYKTWLGIHNIFAKERFIRLNGMWLPDNQPIDRTDENGDHNCLTLFLRGIVGSEPCSYKKEFICTKHKSEIVQNYDCETTDKGYFLESKVKRCYKVHSTPRTWREAYSICKNEEATMAVVNSQEEADLFKEYFTRRSVNILKKEKFVKNVFYLDYTDIFTRGEFLDSYGRTPTEAGYDTWREGQPGRVDSGEHCGVIDTDGKLSYSWCNVRAMFICEKTLKHSIKLIEASLSKKQG